MQVVSEELMKRQALHAFKLRLEEVPAGVGRGESGFLAPLPGDMARCLDLLGIENRGVQDIEREVEEAIGRGVFQ